MRALASATWRLLPRLPALRSSLAEYRASQHSGGASFSSISRLHVQARSPATQAAGSDGSGGGDASSTPNYKEWRAQWIAFLEQLFEQVGWLAIVQADRHPLHVITAVLEALLVRQRVQSLIRLVGSRRALAPLQGHFSADPGVRSDALAAQPGPMKRAVLSLGRQRGDILYCLDPAKLRALVVSGFPVDDRKVRGRPARHRPAAHQRPWLVPRSPPPLLPALPAAAREGARKG